MIKVEGISKSYTMGDNVLTVLKDISLSIEQGDFVAIMGPSGSGKSSLMNILGLLDVPDKGSYRLNNFEVSKLNGDELAVLRRDVIGFIFQQFNLLPRMSAAENVTLPLLYSQGKFDFERAEELLKLVNLLDRQHHRPNELSGGQQQRVAIARSLVNRPQIIFADEPTGNLDSVSEIEIMKILRELNEQGITIILVTHEDIISQEAKRLIRMRDGMIQSDERLAPINKKKEDDLDFSHKILNPKKNVWRDLFEYIRQGLRTLAANKIRSGLSMLGILIGVAAVVAMMALGKGAQKAIETQLSSLGSNLLLLRPGSSRMGGVAQESGSITKLSIEDALELKNNIKELKSISPSVNGRGQATYANKNTNTQIQGVTEFYASMRNLEVNLGRFLNAEENRKRARVAVIGSTVAQELFGDSNPIGENIKINKINFQVIGLLPEKGASGWRDQDDIIYVPLNTAMYRLLGKTTVDVIELEVSDSKDMEWVEEEVLRLLYQRHKIPPSLQDDAFRIRNMAEIQAALSQSSKTMSTLLAAIAAISLLVGGIGIMNIMLVSVTERTKEIGLRKSIGARSYDILSQFLAESTVVSVVGGFLGIVIGWAISYSISLITGWATIVSIFSVILAFGFSAGIGILFGIYPARKAARLNPIEALRWE